MNYKRADKKIISRPNLREAVDQAKCEGKTVVFTNGCFDILHIGHVRYLINARSLGDILIIGLNSDDSVSRLKGPERPINPEVERAEILAALECVDYVSIFNEDTPVELITSIKPNIHVKGGDYKVEDLPEAEAVRSVGGIVKVVPFSSTATEGLSTTRLISKISKNRQ